jgi:hypothetical protein
VDLSDGKPIPPEMHVTLTADQGTDTQMAVIAPDGSFEFKGLVKGVYSISAGVKGYSASYGATTEVLVNRDRKDVVIRVEADPPVKKGG